MVETRMPHALSIEDRSQNSHAERSGVFSLPFLSPSSESCHVMLCHVFHVELLELQYCSVVYGGETMGHVSLGRAKSQFVETLLSDGKNLG